jgi:hypothetical protein
MKKKDDQQHRLGLNLSNTEGQQVVRARCMVPAVIVSPLTVEGNALAQFPPLKKFRSGWITLSEGKNSANASPIPTGAYIVTTGSLSCNFNSTIKSIHPAGTVLEVDATRVEFEKEEKMMKCDSCGRENTYHVVAVRALISSGGYVRLFVISVGISGTHGNLCACGKLVQQTYAKPAPLGTYRITQPTNLTQDVGHKSPTVALLNENIYVQVAETRVEQGCVRGRVDTVVDNVNALDKSGDQSRRIGTLAGWVNLFEPPSSRWAEFTTQAAA